MKVNALMGCMEAETTAVALFSLKTLRCSYCDGGGISTRAITAHVVLAIAFQCDGADSGEVGSLAFDENAAEAGAGDRAGHDDQI